MEINISETLGVLPLRTPTLPPATHTNTVFVGRDDFWIVDPATPRGEDRAILMDAIKFRQAQGRSPAGIVLTHHHRDHIGAASWLSESLGLSILAHPKTAQLTQGKVPIHRSLAEGEILVGSSHDDDRWEVLHTPGHASDHLVLWQAESGAMVGGDMVAAVGTIIVVPPDGHMATYIAQLQRLASLKPKLLVPAHGDVITEPVAKLEHYICHRLEREAKVFAALQAKGRSLMEVTADAYPELPEAMHRLASQSCLAHLLKLEEDGRATQDEESWRYNT